MYIESDRIRSKFISNMGQISPLRGQFKKSQKVLTIQIGYDMAYVEQNGLRWRKMEGVITHIYSK